MTPESVRSAADAVPRGRALPFIVEHDFRTVPLGKVNEFFVEESCNGDVELRGVVKMGEINSIWHSKANCNLIHIEYDDDVPFVRIEGDDEDRHSVVLVGLEHFANRSAYKRFVDEMATCNLVVQVEGRHSFTPDPLITLLFEHPIASAISLWLLSRIKHQIDRVADATLAATMDKCKQYVGRAIRRFNNRRIPDERDLTVRLVFPGSTTIILVIRDNHPSEAIDAMAGSLMKSVEALGDVLKEAETVTFVYGHSDEWTFYYATSTDGGAIASEECWALTKKRWAETMSRGPAKDGESGI